MIRSTLGFIYTADFQKVLLITKNKPIFHRGLLNGLGGKCESNEKDLDCIFRETKEESKLVIPKKSWKLIGQLSWTEWIVTVFAAKYMSNPDEALAQTQDPIAWYLINELPPNIISNLNWLIPLGIDVLKNDNPPQVNIEYSS